LSSRYRHHDDEDADHHEREADHFDTREEKIACEKSGGCPDREAVEPDLTLAAAIEETAPIAGAVAKLRPPPFQRVRSLI